MAKFNKLDVPYQWKDEFTKYPHGYTIFEALCNWTKQVDEMVVNQNNWNEYLDNFVQNFEFELQEEVKTTLAKWQDDGLLDTIITNALQTGLNELQTEINDIQTIKPSGSDDTQAIQEQIDLNKTVMLTEGTYHITTLFVKAGTRIIGRGYTRTIVTGNIDGNLITKLTPETDASLITLEGFRLINENTATNKYVIDIDSETATYTGARYSVLRDMQIVGNYGIRLKRVWCVRFDNVRFECQQKVMEIVDGCNNITFRGVMFAGSTAENLASNGITEMLSILGSPTMHTNILFDGCAFENAKVKAIYARNIKGFIIRDGYFETDSTPDMIIRVENCPGAIIEGNYVRCPSTMKYFAGLFNTSEVAGLGLGKAAFRNNIFSHDNETMAVFLDVDSVHNTILDESNATESIKFACDYARRGSTPRQPTSTDILETGSVDFRYSGTPIIVNIPSSTLQGWQLAIVDIIIDETYADATPQTINVQLLDKNDDLVGVISTGASALPASGTAGQSVRVTLKTTSPTYRVNTLKDGYKIKIFGGNGGSIAVKGHARLTLSRFNAL